MAAGESGVSAMQRAVQRSEEDVRALYERLTKLLIARRLTITTMESCTAGQIASLITDTEGSSAVLPGAFVTYCNAAKVRCGVPAAVIERHGVYSAQAALAMAAACRASYGTNIGIGVTGTMGNVDPANGDSIPGQVHFAIDIDGRARAYARELPSQETRLAYKLQVAGEIAVELLGLLSS